MSLMSSFLAHGSVLWGFFYCSFLLSQCNFSPKNETPDLLTSATSHQFNSQLQETQESLAPSL